jgi:hypothetical protein
VDRRQSHQEGARRQGPGQLGRWALLQKAPPLQVRNFAAWRRFRKTPVPSPGVPADRRPSPADRSDALPAGCTFRRQLDAPERDCFQPAPGGTQPQILLDRSTRCRWPPIRRAVLALIAAGTGDTEKQVVANETTGLQIASRSTARGAILKICPSCASNP